MVKIASFHSIMDILSSIKRYRFVKVILQAIRHSWVYFAWHERTLFVRRHFPRLATLGSTGENTFIEYPVYFDSPENVYIDHNVKIRSNARFINSPHEKIYIRQYSVVGSGCTIIPGNHRKTVGVPQFLLGTSHINDDSCHLTVGEDVWIGANVTILSKADIGRGCIVAACSVVTHPTPPYSVVAGQPARIIGKVFEKDDILRHELALYSPDQRLSPTQIDDIFNAYHYDSLKTYGTSVPLTMEQNEIIARLKRDWKYIEPTHNS